MIATNQNMKNEKMNIGLIFETIQQLKALNDFISDKIENESFTRDERYRIGTSNHKIRLTIDTLEEIKRIFHEKNWVDREAVNSKETAKMIFSFCESYFLLNKGGIISKKRTHHISIRRQTTMWLIRKYTNLSLQEVGDMIGCRNHGTVMHAKRTIENEITTNSNDGKLALNAEKSLLQHFNLEAQ